MCTAAGAVVSLCHVVPGAWGDRTGRHEPERIFRQRLRKYYRRWRFERRRRRVLKFGLVEQRYTNLMRLPAAVARNPGPRFNLNWTIQQDFVKMPDMILAP